MFVYCFKTNLNVVDDGFKTTSSGPISLIFNFSTASNLNFSEKHWYGFFQYFSNIRVDVTEKFIDIRLMNFITV